jgi:DNA-binding XRE family transcriptional regulator
MIMPFKQIDVDKLIKEKLDADPELKEIWDSSRMEYRLLGEFIRLRKEKGISQNDLAKMSGYKQQAISRIEKKENSPTLKTMCALADVLEVDILLVPRHQSMN